jgi:hypothetical protein
VLNGKISESSKKSLNIAVAKFDERFINGPEDICYSEKAIWHMPFEKEGKLKFISDEEKIINALDETSQKLFAV